MVKPCFTLAEMLVANGHLAANALSRVRVGTPNLPEGVIPQHFAKSGHLAVGGVKALTDFINTISPFVNSPPGSTPNPAGDEGIAFDIAAALLLILLYGKIGSGKIKLLCTTANGDLTMAESASGGSPWHCFYMRKHYTSVISSARTNVLGRKMGGAPPLLSIAIMDALMGLGDNVALIREQLKNFIYNNPIFMQGSPEFIDLTAEHEEDRPQAAGAEQASEETANTTTRPGGDVHGLSSRSVITTRTSGTHGGLFSPDTANVIQAAERAITATYAQAAAMTGGQGPMVPPTVSWKVPSPSPPSSPASTLSPPPASQGTSQDGLVTPSLLQGIGALGIKSSSPTRSPEVSPRARSSPIASLGRGAINTTATNPVLPRRASSRAGRAPATPAPRVNTHIATPAPHATLSLQTRASGPEGPATVGNAPSKATGKSKSTLASQAQSEAPGRSKSTRASQAPRDTSGPPSGTGAQ